MKNNDLNTLLIIISIIMFFIFIVSFSAYYTKENFAPVCGCSVPIWLVVVVLPSLGVFVGTLTYYIFNKKQTDEKIKMNKNILKTLNFLERDEKKVIKKIIEKKGEINQKKLTESTGLDKVKISRIINTLEKKDIIKKQKNGMTNKIILDNQLKEIYLDD